MSSAALTLIDRTRYQIIKAFALGVSISATFLSILAIIFLIVNPDPKLIIILGISIFDVIIAVTVLILQKHRPIWEMTILLACTLSIGIIAAGFLFPDAKIVILTIFVVVILLVNLIGNPQLTIGVLIASTLIASIMILVSPMPNLTMPLGNMLPIIQVSTIISIFVLVWLINDRQTMALISSINLSNQRTIEAEKARAESESARFEVERRNEEQARLLELVQTLELPVIPIGEQVLVMPLVGSLDSRRAEAIQRRLLNEVTRLRAHTVVLDVTGISIMDTAVARQLLQTAQAVRLLGARTLLSGMSATVAQTLVGLGVNLDDLTPVSDLGQALDKARQN